MYSRAVFDMTKMRKMLSPWEDAEFTDVTKRRRLYVYAAVAVSFSPAVPSIKPDERRTNFNPSAPVGSPRIARFKDPGGRKTPLVARSLGHAQTNSNRAKRNSGLSFRGTEGIES